MLNPLRPVMTRVFTPVGAVLARTPVTANAITIVGTVGVAGGALGLFPIGELFPGALTCTIFVLLDMLDGVLARIKGTSGTWGAFLDSTMDRIADAGIFSGLVIWFFRGGHDPLVGVSGLGVPYILNVGLWALAAGSAFTFGQRVHAVYRAARTPVAPGEREERAGG
jgi:CDP-diacylglycerol--glycerol-3-phosphate 3-phosphatidyltransferase